MAVTLTTETINGETIIVAREVINNGAGDDDLEIAIAIDNTSYLDRIATSLESIANSFNVGVTENLAAKISNIESHLNAFEDTVELILDSAPAFNLHENITGGATGRVVYQNGNRLIIANASGNYTGTITGSVSLASAVVQDYNLTNNLGSDVKQYTRQADAIRVFLRQPATTKKTSNVSFDYYENRTKRSNRFRIDVDDVSLNEGDTLTIRIGTPKERWRDPNFKVWIVDSLEYFDDANNNVPVRTEVVQRTRLNTTINTSDPVPPESELGRVLGGAGVIPNKLSPNQVAAIVSNSSGSFGGITPATANLQQGLVLGPDLPDPRSAVGNTSLKVETLIDPSKVALPNIEGILKNNGASYGQTITWKIPFDTRGKYYIYVEGDKRATGTININTAPWRVDEKVTGSIKGEGYVLGYTPVSQTGLRGIDIYDIHHQFEIGETITGDSSGLTGEIIDIIHYNQILTQRDSENELGLAALYKTFVEEGYAADISNHVPAKQQALSIQKIRSAINSAKGI